MFNFSFHLSRNVEEKNTEITKGFQQTYLEHVESMRNSLTATVTQQKEAVQNISSQFGEGELPLSCGS